MYNYTHHYRLLFMVLFKIILRKWSLKYWSTVGIPQEQSLRCRLHTKQSACSPSPTNTELSTTASFSSSASRASVVLLFLRLSCCCPVPCCSWIRTSRISPSILCYLIVGTKWKPQQQKKKGWSQTLNCSVWCLEFWLSFCSICIESILSLSLSQYIFKCRSCLYSLLSWLSL